MAATFAQLLGDLHHERFVGRTAELAACEAWLGADGAPPILAVSGIGGIGKTWLLEELVRGAQERGWSTRRFDAVAALTAGDPADGMPPARRAGEVPAVGPPGSLVVFDGIDALGPAVGQLQRALSDLQEGTRVVLSSRQALRGGVWRAWEPLTRYLEVGPLDPDDQRRYLDRRGIDDVARREQVLLRTGGHPLTLSLAVDLIVNAGDVDFVGSPVWRSAVRMTVEELMGEVGDRFRAALEAAAVLQRIDRDALAAVLGAAEADRAFVRLCALSATRVVADQLVLHDDVRRAVVEDLRLHHPRRLDEIRRAALRHYRQRAAVGGDAGARWSIEQLHLIGRDLFGVSYLYDEHPTLTVLPATPAEFPEMLDLLARTPALPGLPAVESDPVRVARILADPECVAHLARDHTGTLRGYGFYLRLTEGNRRLLGEGDAMATLVDATALRLGAPDGKLPERSNVYYLSTVMTTTDDDLAVGAVLGNNALSLLLAEGAYLFVPAVPYYVQLIDSFLAQPLCPDLAETNTPLKGRLLDLSRCGFAGWVQSLMAGRPLAEVPVGPELTAVVAAAVDAFDDDGALAASVVAQLAEPGDDVGPTERAGALRQLLTRSLHAEGAWPTPETRIGTALTTAGITSLPAVADSSNDVGVEPDVDAAAGIGDGIHVRILGGLAVSHRGATVPVAQGAVAVAIKILALRRSVPADELIELLWPDLDEAVGRDRLRNLLSRIRRTVAPDLVSRQGAQIVLGESVAVGAERFAAAATDALREDPQTPGSLERCREAVAAYGGELLPGERFSEWAAAPRERYARLYLALLDRLAECAVAAGDAVEAVGWLEQAIDADPYDEDRYVRAAELLADSGRRGRALALVQRAQSAAATIGVPVAAPVIALQRRLRATG